MNAGENLVFPGVIERMFFMMSSICFRL